MIRSPVVRRMVNIPMEIKVQKEGDRWVAVMPAYIFPVGMIAEGDSMMAAEKSLKRVFSSVMWGKT